MEEERNDDDDDDKLIIARKGKIEVMKVLRDSKREVAY